jgi:filamentous hemagglutinin
MSVAVGETATAVGKETGQRSCGGATSVSSAPSGQVLRVRQIAFAALVLLGVIPAWSSAQMVPGGANAPSRYCRCERDDIYLQFLQASRRHD